MHLHILNGEVRVGIQITYDAVIVMSQFFIFAHFGLYPETTWNNPKCVSSWCILFFPHSLNLLMITKQRIDFSWGTTFKDVLLSTEVPQWHQQPTPFHPISLTQGVWHPALDASHVHLVPLCCHQLICFGAFIFVTLTIRLMINSNNKIFSAQTEEEVTA